MSSPAPSSPSQRLALIIETLRNAVAHRAGRNRAMAPLVLILWPYLGRLAMRFEALAARLLQGRPAASSPPRPDRPAPTIRRPRLPTGFAWLVRLAQETAVFGSQLKYLLGDAQMRDLLAASPQAAKLLRPLCRMLGIGPSPDIPAALFPPRERPRPPVAARQAEPRTQFADSFRPPPGQPKPV